MYKNILFDVDGTLTDPVLGITNSAMYALSKFGINVSDRTELYKFIGPPLKDSFKNFYGFSEEDSVLAVKYFREVYNVTGLFENEVYEGIPEALAKLKEAGCRLIVATCKPEPIAKSVLEHFGLDKYFEFLAGSTFDGKRIEKADVVAHALTSCGITTPEDIENTIMVGDRSHDILGAAANNLDTIAVLYGYGSMKEFQECDAAYIVSTPDGICNICLN